MVAPTLTIAGKAIGFERAWVHLKGDHAYEPVNYVVAVPLYRLPQLFDPHQMKPATQSWSVFIRTMVDEFGTFILDGYFDSLRKATTEAPKSFGLYEWVIANLHSVEEKDGFLLLHGQAERFEPQRFASPNASLQLTRGLLSRLARFFRIG
jgi:hypothetical protein